MRFKLFNLISSFLMSGSSPFMLFSGTNVDSVLSTFNIGGVASNIIGLFCEIIYSVTKWGMYIVDIIFFYMRQLCGLEMDMSSLNSAFSEESDIIFNLLLSNSGQVLEIVKALIGVAIVMIIVFSIIAIVKNQFNSLKNDAPADIGGVFRTALKSFFLIIIIPFVAILSIIASNVLLKSLYNATNVYGANSLSSSVFAASSSAANRYRLYALDGNRIPIYFDFSKQQEILDYYDKNPGNETMDSYLVSAENKIYTTYVMFANKTYTPFNTLRVSEQENIYYETFDLNPNAEESMKPYARIRAYQPEYFVMADVIDYAVKSNNILYIKTIEQVLDSVYNLVNISEFSGFVNTFKIELLENDTVKYSYSDGSLTYANYAADDWNVIRYYSDYIGANEDGEPSERHQIEYTHVRGATDEIDGAVFVMTSEKIGINKDTNLEMGYYYPLCNGDSDYGTTVLESEYIRKGQIIAAKGIFNEDGYPTAIRLSNDKSQVQFYRDNLVEISLGDTGGILGANVVETDESGGIGGIFSAISKFFKRLFNPASLVPNLEFDGSAVSQTYTKETSQVNQLSDGGKIHISYMFSDALTNTLMTKGGFKLYNLFEPNSINYFLLIVGTFLLLKTCFIAIFALIKRAYDLFLIIIFYPSVCGLMPLDDGKSMGEWTRTYSSKLFMTYGLILGINFVIMLFPVIESIDYFTPAEVSTTKIIRRVGVLFFKVLTPNQIATMMNLFVAVLFQLVAFTMLDTAPDIIGTIVGGENHKSENVFGDIMKFVSSTLAVVGKVTAVTSVLTKKGRERVANEFKDKASQFIPAGELVGAAKDRINLDKKKKAQKEAYRDLKESLETNATDRKYGDKKKEIEEKMNAFMKAQQGYTNALEKPREDRKAEDARRRDEEKSGVSSRADDDLDENGMSEEFKSDRQIDNDIKQAKRHLKYLAKKEKRGGLSEEEEKAKSTYQDILDRAEEEKGQRKSDKKGLKEADKELKELEAKKESGEALTPEEQKKYDELNASRTEMQNRATNREAGRAQQKQDIKDKKKQQKIDAKEAEKAAKEERSFKRMGRGSSREQKAILKKRGKEALELERQLVASGANFGDKPLNQMSVDEIDKLAKDPNSGLTTDQLAKLKDYQSHRTRTEGLVRLTVSEYVAYEENQTKKGKRKNKDVIASRNLFRRGISGGRRSKKAANSGAKQTQISQIDKQIAALDLSDPSNIAKRKKLMKKKADLQAQVATSEDWTENNNSERRKEIRQERKEIRQRHMQVKHRRAKAIEEGGDLSEDGIKSWISSYNEQEYKKKKKQEQEDKEQKDKEAKEKQDKRDKLYGGNPDSDKQ